MFVWNSKNTTYYDRGKKAFSSGDEIPDEILKSMGKETFEEYLEKGLICDESAIKEPEVIEETEEEIAERERDAMLERAKVYGLKPHPKTGIVKLTAMVEDFEALQTLKTEASELGIDSSDDIGFAELSILVEEKKAENESDS